MQRAPTPFYKPRPVLPPGATTGQQKMPPDIQKLIDQAVQDYMKKSGGNAAATGSSGSAAAGGAGGAAASQLGGSGLASTAEANAAWNSAGMGGEVLPEAVLPETGLATLAPYAGAAAGTYLVGKGLNDAYKGRTDNSTKGKAARAQTAWTTMGGSEVLRKVAGGKNKDQKGRDANRSVGKSKGVYDDKFNYTRLDGVTKNLGLDGSKGQYNIDFDKDKAAVDLIPWLDPLSEVIAGGDAKRRSDQTGEFANILKDSKDPQAEIRALYNKFGVTADSFKDMKSDDNRADVYRNSVGQVFNGQMQKPNTPPPIARPTPGSIDPGFEMSPDEFLQKFPGSKLPGASNLMPTVIKPGTNLMNGISGAFNGQLQKGPAPLKPVNNPNSPGFKDGKRISNPTRK